MLAVLPVVAPGSRPPRPPTTCTSLHLSSGWLCSAASACLFGTAMPPAGFAARFLIGGVTMPFAAAVEATLFFATMLSATLCAPLPVSSLLFHPSWKSPASCSLPGTRIPVAPAPAPISALIFTLPLAVDAVPRTFGSPGVPQASLRPGTSPSRPSFAPPFSPRLLHLWLGFFHEVETHKNSFQNTASQVAALGATFRPLVLEACGEEWSPALPEVVAWVSTESRVTLGLAGDTPRDVSLRISQRISCTLHRENARAVLRRAPETVNGSSGLTGNLVSGTGW